MQFPKREVFKCPKWLKKVREELRCVIRGTPNPDPAHIRYGFYTAGAKPSDKLVLPLCRELHDLQHRMGEVKFWCTYLPENPEFLMYCLKAGAEKLHKENMTE